MKLKKNIAMSDTGFVFDPATGNSFTTNPIGIEIIQMLKQDKNDKEIEEEIHKNYEIDQETFERDLFDFMNVLTKMRLTE
jgi:hypothetical protein